jgi:hypothetical protein
LTSSGSAFSAGLKLAPDRNIDVGVVSFTDARIDDSWSGAAETAAAMMEARAYGSDWIAVFTISDADSGAAVTAALIILSMVLNGNRPERGWAFKREIFSAQTTIFPAKPGRNFTAVDKHEINLVPSSRTAVEMKAVRNSPAAPVVLLDARTVIGWAISSAGGDEICSALATRTNSTLRAVTNTRHRELFVAKNIGRLAALDLLLGS